MDNDKQDKTKEFEEILRSGKKGEIYFLRLFVAGINPRSRKAIDNLKKICKEELSGKCEVEIIDIYQQPEYAKEGQIIAAPTLVKELPLPIRRFVGDLSDSEKILVGLEVRSKENKG